MVIIHGGSLKNTLRVLLMENVNQGNSAIFMFRILIIKGVKKYKHFTQTDDKTLFNP